MRRILLTLAFAMALGLSAGLVAADSHEGANPCNPCGETNPCNPCGEKNPCNPCNPCGEKNPCNPCGSGSSSSE